MRWRRWPAPVFLWWFTLSWLLTRTLARLANVTVDDSDLSRIIYASQGEFTWKVGNNCTSCTFHPDKTMFHNETWHDGFAKETGEKQISLQFKGVAIYVYMATISNTYITTQLTFTLDGMAVGSFRANDINATAPLTSATYNYNQTVFWKTGLSNSDHLLVVSNQYFDTFSDILFDYFIYTSEEPDSTTNTDGSGGVSAGVIAGAAIGGVVVVGALIGLIIWLVRRRKRVDRNKYRLSMTDAGHSPSRANPTVVPWLSDPPNDGGSSSGAHRSPDFYPSAPSPQSPASVMNRGYSSNSSTALLSASSPSIPSPSGGHQFNLPHGAAPPNSGITPMPPAAAPSGLASVLSAEVATMRAQIQRLESQLGQQHQSATSGDTEDSISQPPPSYEKVELSRRLEHANANTRIANA